MGLFDKKICADCGKEVGKLAFTFKEDKQCLCKKCVEKLPNNEYRDYAKKFWTATYYKNTYLPFLKESEERRKNFKLKAWYGGLFIDEKNRVICYSPIMSLMQTTDVARDLFEYTPIIKFDDISKESMLYFDTQEVKEGLFGYASHGNMMLKLHCNYPEFHFDGVIKRDLTIKNKKKDKFLNLPENFIKVHDLFCTLLGTEEQIQLDRRN